jgi:hypothetical protein
VLGAIFVFSELALQFKDRHASLAHAENILIVVAGGEYTPVRGFLTVFVSLTCA